MLVTTREAEFNLEKGEAFVHSAFPGLLLSIDAIFAALDRWRKDHRR